MNKSSLLRGAVLIVVPATALAAPHLSRATSSHADPRPAPSIRQVESGPTISITGDGTPGRATIAVTGVGPRRFYLVYQCRAADGSPSPDEDCDTTKAASRTVQADRSGAISLIFALRATIGVAGLDEVDCIAEPCVLALADPGGILATTPITWADGVEAPAAPRLTIVRLAFRKHANRGSATVAGEGFPPGARATVVQCPSAPPDDCLWAYGTRVRADRAGRWISRVVVYRKFQRPEGDLIDCGEAPELCALVVPNSGDYRLSRVTLDEGD